MARTKPHAKRGQPGGPKAAAFSKTPEKPDRWKAPGQLEQTVAALAALAVKVIEEDASDVHKEAASDGRDPAQTRESQDAMKAKRRQRMRDVKVLQQVYQIVGRHQAKAGYAALEGVRLTPAILRYARARAFTEHILRSVREPVSEQRDQAVVEELIAAYEMIDLRCPTTALVRVLREMREEFWNPISRSYDRDWASGTYDAAGKVVERLGLRLGWRGSSGGSTAKYLTIFQEYERTRPDRRREHVRTISFMLASLGVPAEFNMLLQVVVGLILLGRGDELQRGEMPSNLEQILTLKSPYPSRPHPLSTSDSAQHRSARRLREFFLRDSADADDRPGK